jgi:hypothetical protein
MAINTYFKNIADAIREKTGGSAFITPGQMPGEIRSISTGSSVDLTAVNVIGMQVDATRNNDFSSFNIQVGAIFLCDENDNNYTWGKASGGAWGGLMINQGENANNLIRNNYTGNLKLLLRVNGNANNMNLPSGFILFLENPVDCTIYKKWKWYTANDGTERDPKTFGLIIGNYNAGSLITEIRDYGTRTITTNRNALAYTGVI